MLKLEARYVFMEQFPNKEKQKIYASIRTFMTGRQKTRQNSNKKENGKERYLRLLERRRCHVKR